MPSLDIMIINWNAGSRLRNCLDSIAAVDKRLFRLNRVVVVDNASVDGSIDGLEDLKLDIPLTIIRNAENLGFAKASNQGAEGSTADYLLLLNPDTRLFKESLNIPIEFMERPENGDIGIVGIQHVDEQNRVKQTCIEFPTPTKMLAQMVGLNSVFKASFGYFMPEFDCSTSQEVDHFMAAFWLTRCEVYKTLLMDERFFVYVEDLDFSLRAKQLGWRSYYLATAQVFHEGGATTEHHKTIRLFYGMRSRILYTYKHFGWFPATALLLATFTVEPFTRTARALWHRNAGTREVLASYMLLGQWLVFGRHQLGAYPAKPRQRATSVKVKQI